MTFRAITHTSLVLGLFVAASCSNDDNPPAAPTCTDGLANQNETDVDCGGTTCPACARGQSCGLDNDCDGELICVGNRCVRIACDDGVQNQGETDLDCGGPNCHACPLGGACAEDSDCLAGTCQSGACVASATPMDEFTLCAMYYYSGNAADNMCTQRSLGSGQDYSASNLGWVCRPGDAGWSWASSFLTAVSESRITVDWTAAAQCVSDARNYRYTHPAYTLVNDSAWDTIVNVTCKTFFSGNVGDNVACKEDWDCGEGRGCYSDTPSVAGSAFCMAPADENDPCNVEFHPCGKALRCDDSTGTCMSKLANGATCASDDDCGSGWCDFDYEECADNPSIQAGDPCSSSEECSGACLACRPSEPGTQSICQTMGAEGDFCRDWWDCLDDLGCTDNQCGTVGEGARCGSITEGVCESGVSCVPPVNCSEFDGDQAGCANNAEICAFDDYYGYCDAVAGDCVTLPDLGEACLYDLYCGAGYCDTATTQCTAFGGQGETCSETQPCDENAGYSCTGTCVRFCQYREDCPTNQYCWPGNDTTPPQCMPINESECASHDACPAGDFCDLPGTHCFKSELDDIGCNADPECTFVVEPGSCESDDVCLDYAESGTCTADSDCQWAPTSTCEYIDCAGLDQGTCTGRAACWWDTESESCYPGCWEYDGDASGCVGTGVCYYDEGMGWCMNSCGDNDNQPEGTCTGFGGGGYCYWTDTGEACFSVANLCSTFDDDFQGCRDHADHPCAYAGSAYCDRTDPEATGVCLLKQAVGGECIPDNIESMGPTPSDDATMCQSGYAIQQGASELDFVCSVRPSNPVNGCNFVNETTAALLNTVFAFGGVWFLGRRVRRRKIK